MIKIDVNIGDTILMGKFKNKPVVVKTIGTDEHGMPTINGKKVATFRIKKENIGENKMKPMPRAKNGVAKMKKGMTVKMMSAPEMKKYNLHADYMKYNLKVAGKTLVIKRVIKPPYRGPADSFEVEGYPLYRDHSGFDEIFIKSLVKENIQGENKMAKKKKLDEGMILMSSMIPGQKPTLSLRGNKEDNFEFKGLPGQFDKDGNKVLDEYGDPIKEEEIIVNEMGNKIDEAEPSRISKSGRSGGAPSPKMSKGDEKHKRPDRYYQGILIRVKDELEELLEAGEDYGIWRDAKYTAKAIKQAQKLLSKAR
jgi:hypothetical protein